MAKPSSQKRNQIEKLKQETELVIDVIEAMKVRYLRMYRDVCKVIYGPYMLLPSYKQFIKQLEEWREEKRYHFKSFINFISSEADFTLV